MKAHLRFPYKGAGIALVCDKKVLLGIRSKKPFMGKWSVPGGGREKGESYFEGAKREFYEETGCNIETISCTYFGKWTLCLPPFFHWTTFFFKTNTTDISLNPCEFSKLEWISIDSISTLSCRPFTYFEIKKLKWFFNKTL